MAEFLCLHALHSSWSHLWVMKPSPLHAFISLSLHHLSRLICQFPNRPVCLGHTSPRFLFISLFTKLNSSHSFCFQSSQVLRERALLTSLLPTSLFLSPCLLPTNAYYSSDGICLFACHCLPVSSGVQTLTCHCHTLSVQCHILHTVDA